MTREPPLEHPHPADSRPALQTWRLLFLDMHAHVERLKAACLDDGYTAVGAETPDQAMAFLEGTDHVDVVVCGAHLEIGSMIEFLARVRANALHERTQFMILSLEPGPAALRLERSTAQAGIVLGANIFVYMPVFDPDALLAQIRKLRPEIPVLQQDPP